MANDQLNVAPASLVRWFGMTLDDLLVAAHAGPASHGEHGTTPEAQTRYRLRNLMTRCVHRRTTDTMRPRRGRMQQRRGTTRRATVVPAQGNWFRR